MPPLRLLFDECCSRQMARELLEFYRSDHPGLEVRHVLENFKPGTRDPVWLAPLRADRSWIVITKDSGKNSSKLRLPMICRAWKITHVALTPALIQAGFTAHKAALSAIWPHLPELHRLPRGTRLRLGFDAMRGAMPSYTLRIGAQALSSVLARQAGSQGEA